MKRIAVLLLGLCLLTGCAGTGEEEMNIMIENGEQQTAYDQVAVKRGDITHEISISCKYMPKERIQIAFEGQQRIITEVLVEKGDFVTKGDVLARQDVEEFEELILEEQHAIEMQQLTLTQLEEMKALDLGLMEKSYNFQDEETRDGEAYRLNKEKTEQRYKEQIEDCQDSILVHTLKLEEYKNNVEEGTMRAPASGIITASEADLIGTISQPSEEVITMVANEALIFVSEEVDKEQYLEYGKTYSVNVGKGEASRTVEVTLLENEKQDEQPVTEICFSVLTPDMKLNTGAPGTIWIPLEEKKDVLYLPNHAIHTSGDKTYVYTMSENGIRNIIYITTGASDREKTEIIKGLEEGQYVLQ